MNYGLRNTLILLLTLILMLGGGWLFVHLKYSSTLEELEEEAEQKQQTLDQIAETAELYDMVVYEHSRQNFIREHHPKELFPDPNAGRLYDYLRELNQGISFTELNYVVQDSVVQDDHGYVNITVSGEGFYRNLYNFIHRIEHSRPIIQIRSVQLQNITELERLTRVTFRMDLAAYYNRDDRLDYDATLATAEAPGDIGYNPYFPLIHPVRPNEEGLVEVDNSRLIGMTSRFILIRDQNDAVLRLTVGDPVYLGRLQSINTDTQEAVFRLNRGGLLDVVTMTLD